MLRNAEALTKTEVIDPARSHAQWSQEQRPGLPRHGQISVIRPYRKAVMKNGENKVRFDVFSEETGAYTASCYAFASPALAAELHRQHGYRVGFNDKPKYPQILEILEEVEIPNRFPQSTSAKP